MPTHPSGSTSPGGSDIDRTIPMPPGREGERAPDTAAVGEGYRVGGLLGRGGEGEVHEAEQLAFGRTVAIKTLRGGSVEPRLVQRFRAEAAVTALLEHPNIIPVHDLRVDALGRLQLVMKRVSGRTWRELIDAGNVASEDHIAILLKVCDAVDFAHSRGVLHRDLKPENVMVGAHGEVLVMDWGCAVHRGPVPPHPDIPVLTEIRGISGTPSYISPEQARGDHAACGPWSDVHLLGASLYRMLCRMPLRYGGGVRELIARAARGEPPKDPREYADVPVSAELAAIAMAAVHPDPAQRTRSVADFAGALRRHLEHREALVLVDEARRQHALAAAGGPGADDAYRRAIGACEQAIRLWPELGGAHRLAVEIGIASARHAHANGALRLAVRQAQAAAAAAESLGDAESAATARRIAAAADAREASLRARELHVQRMRRLALAAGAVAGVALLVGLVVAWTASARRASALAEAQANLERAERERAARIEGERLAAPALLAQARELAIRRNFAEGLPLVEVAAGFAPGDPQPLLLQAELLIAMGRRGEAASALERALALHPDPDAAELRRLCLGPPADADARIADILVRMGAGAEAGVLSLSAERKTAIAMAQLRRAWPELAATHLTALADGTLALRLTGADQMVESLEPLRGLPISSIDLSGQTRLRDLGPLASLPLASLTARVLAARDFSALRGLPLRRVALTGLGGPLDLEILHGAPLETLETSGAGLADLAPLAGMPLHELRLIGCDRLADISALRGAPIEALALDAPTGGANRLIDLSPLLGKQLRELSLAGQRAIGDITLLSGMPLRRVFLTGAAIEDLRPVANPALRYLGIADTAITDIRPILTCPLETIEFSPQTVKKGVEAMTRIPTLRSACGLRVPDLLAWVALQNAIADANPDYPWTAKPVFAAGHLSELRFVSPLRSLAPLSGLADLRILHLSGQVADLRPLAGLKLVELVVAPAPGALGLDGLRKMASLQRIGPTLARLVPVAEYWSGR